MEKYLEDNNQIKETEKELNHYPFEYISAQVFFAQTIAEKTNESINKCMIEYTDLYNSVTNKAYGKDEEKGNFTPTWINYVKDIQKFTNPKEISEHTYNLYLKQNKPKESKENLKIFGCFGINYEEYNKQRQQIRLHFVPLRKDLHKTNNSKKFGDLSSEYMDKRKEEFKEMVKYINDNPKIFETAKYLKSSTWLQNIPNYQKLFPEKYSNENHRTKKDNNFLGLWGQFVKWDLTGNTEIYEQFLDNLNKSKNLNEIKNSFPYPVYEIKVPLEEMFTMWL